MVGQKRLLHPSKEVIMCGIIGYKGNKPNPELLKQARDTMTHRGPDDAGMFVDERNGVIVGHRRLSIIDLSAAGHQPMEIDEGRFIIVFNGEVYNYLELKKELAHKYQFTSGTDTEVIAWAYKEWGVECLKKFNGMFAFVIYDRERNILFGARDRVGKKPLYYHWKNGEFFFASEIKALLRFGVPALPNNRIIYEYLAKGWYEHSDQTFFEDILKVPPGHYFLLEDNSLSFVRYWDISTVTKRRFRNLDEAKQELLDLLRDSVRLRLRSDVPVGINLSGGLDSSSLMSLVQEMGDHRQIHAFSACYRNSEYDESPFMKAIVEQYRCPWHQSFLDPAEVMPLAKELVRFEDEPFGGIPTIAHYKLHKLARAQGVTVLLEGQGMDELMAGYKYHLTPFYHDAVRGLDIGTLKQELWQMTREQGGSVRAALAFFGKVLFQNTLQQKHFDYTNPLRPGCLRKDFMQEWSSFERTFPKPFDSNLDNFLYRDVFFTKIPRVLRFNDRLSMASSIELRMPYLDYRIIEFCFSLENTYRIKKGKGKMLMRQTMEHRSLASQRTSHKRSIVSPQTAWLKHELRDAVRQVVLSDSFLQRPFVNEGLVREEVEKFFVHPIDNSFYIWQWMNLEMWFREYIDRSPS